MKTRGKRLEIFPRYPSRALGINGFAQPLQSLAAVLDIEALGIHEYVQAPLLICPASSSVLGHSDSLDSLQPTTRCLSDCCCSNPTLNLGSD